MEYEQLSWPETRALFQELDATGDPAVRDRLILANLPLSRWIASRFAAQRGGDWDDLRAEAALAMVRAVDGFEVSKGFRFGTYAYRSVYTELMNFNASSRWPLCTLSRRQGQTLAAYHKAHARLSAAGDRPTDEEVFDRMGANRIDRELLSGLLAMTRSYRTGSDPCGRDSLALSRVPVRDDAGDCERRAEARRTVAAVLGRLTTPEADLIRERFGIGGGGPKSLRAMVRPGGPTKDRVRQRLGAVLQKARVLSAAS